MSLSICTRHISHDHLVCNGQVLPPEITGMLGEHENGEGRRALCKKWQRCVSMMSTCPRACEPASAASRTQNRIPDGRWSLAFVFQGRVSKCGQEQNKVFGVGRWQPSDG